MRSLRAAVPVFLLFVSAWEAGIRLFSISPFLLPGPVSVAQGLFDLMISGQLVRHAVASLFRVTWGYLLAASFAIVLGIFLGLRKGPRHFLNPLIHFLRPISPLAWIPLAMLWFGIGDPPAIFLIFLASFFPILLFTIDGVMSIKITYLRVAQNLDIRGWQFMKCVVLPAALPEIVTGLRVTLGTAWLVIVAAEMMAVKSGLGYLIIDARNSLNMNHVIAGMVAVGVIGLALDNVVKRLEFLPEVKWKRLRR